MLKVMAASRFLDHVISNPDGVENEDIIIPEPRMYFFHFFLVMCVKIVFHLYRVPIWIYKTASTI